MEEMLTVAEVAVALKCTEQHVRYLIRKRRLGAMNHGGEGQGSRYRIPNSALLQFIERNTIVVA